MHIEGRLVESDAPIPATFKPSTAARTVHIAQAKGWGSLGLHELWEHRELLYFLVWRDVTVRYKQTFLGAAWAVVQHLSAMVVFSLFFGRLAKMPSEGIPYPIFAYAALVPWMWFANGLNQVSQSILRNSNLITKVYFPRLVIPLAAALAGAVDFAVAFLVLLGMMVFYRMVPTANILWIPGLALLALGCSLGAGLWFSALNVRYRDVPLFIPLLMQLWLFATPVVYPSSLVPARWRLVHAINPMTGVIEGFRWALLGTHTHPGPQIIISVLMVLVLTTTGVFYFRRTERSFADII